MLKASPPSPDSPQRGVESLVRRDGSGATALFSYSFAVIKNNSALKELLVKPKTSKLKVTLSWSKVQGRKPWLPQAPRQPVYPVHRPAERVLGCGLPGSGGLGLTESITPSSAPPHQVEVSGLPWGRTSSEDTHQAPAGNS